MDLFKKDLRSVLIADQQGIPIQRLNKEFRDLTGENIEWDQKVYATLKDFLLTIPDACIIKEEGYETLVLPVVTEKEAVIKELVDGQKNSKLRRKSSFRFGSKKYVGRKIFDKYQRQRYNRPFVPVFRPRQNYARSPPKKVVNERFQRYFNVNSSDRSFVKRSPVRRSRDRSIDRSRRVRRSPSYESYNRMGNRRRSLSRSPSPDRQRRIRRRYRFESPVARRLSPRRINLSRTRRRSNSRKRDLSFDGYNRKRDRSPDEYNRKRSVRSKSKSPIRRRANSPIRSNAKDHNIRNSENRRNNSITQTKNQYVTMIKDFLTKESPMTRTPKMPQAVNNYSNNNNQINRVNHSNSNVCNRSRFSQISNGSIGVGVQKANNNIPSYDCRVNNNQPIKDNFTVFKSQAQNLVSRDPRTRKRSQSVSAAFKCSDTIDTLMSQPFDVRAKENKRIQIKIFKNNNVISSNAIAETRSRRDLFEANNKQSEIENEIETEAEFGSRNIIEKIRDYSPDYRNKKSTNHSFDTDHNNSLAPIDNDQDHGPIYDIDSDYLSDGPLISYQSLRSFTKKVHSNESVVQSKSFSEDDSVMTWLDEDLIPDKNRTFNSLNLSNVEINYPSNNEIQTAVKLNKLAVLKITIAIPKSISEFASPEANNGYFVPDIINTQQASVNFVHEMNFLNSKINYKIELKRFAKENNLPEPLFNQTVYMNKDNTIGGYSSKLEIGPKVWFTVLNTHQTPDDADNNVAKKALEELKIDAIRLEKDDNLVPKIIKLFKNKRESLCNSVVERRYTDLYEKTIEPNWLDLIRSSSCFYVKERLLDENTLIYTVELASQM